MQLKASSSDAFCFFSPSPLPPQTGSRWWGPRRKQSGTESKSRSRWTSTASARWSRPQTTAPTCCTTTTTTTRSWTTTTRRTTRTVATTTQAQRTLDNFPFYAPPPLHTHHTHHTHTHTPLSSWTEL